MATLSKHTAVTLKAMTPLKELQWNPRERNLNPVLNLNPKP